MYAQPCDIFGTYVLCFLKLSFDLSWRVFFYRAKQSQAREDVIVMQTLHNKCASNHDDGETITADSNGYI